MRAPGPVQAGVGRPRGPRRIPLASRDRAGVLSTVGKRRGGRLTFFFPTMAASRPTRPTAEEKHSKSVNFDLSLGADAAPPALRSSPVAATVVCKSTFRDWRLPRERHCFQRRDVQPSTCRRADDVIGMRQRARTRSLPHRSTPPPPGRRSSTFPAHLGRLVTVRGP